MNPKLSRTMAGLAIVCAFAGGVVAAPRLARTVPVVTPAPIIVDEHPIVLPMRDAYESKTALAEDEEAPPAEDTAQATDAVVDDSDEQPVTARDDRPLPANIVGAPAAPVAPVETAPPPSEPASDASPAPTEQASDAPTPPTERAQADTGDAPQSAPDGADASTVYPFAAFVYVPGKRPHVHTYPTFQRPSPMRGRR